MSPLAARPTRGIRRPAPVAIELDGQRITAYPGESLATSILASGRRAFRRTPKGDVRGPYCNMGVCFECSVMVDGRPGVRACMTEVRAGMVVETGVGDG